jgi:hypothetical protein
VRRIISYGLGLILWLPVSLSAQHVIYSDSYNSHSSISLQVIGKSENFYWTEKIQRQRSKSRHVTTEISGIESFGLYDENLNLVREIPPATSPGTLKQWLMAGKDNLDQIMLTASERKTKIYCSRFYTDENRKMKNRLIDSLPFSVHPSGILLTRSADHSKILLVAFENTESEITRVHALLFNANWNLIYHQVISNEQFSQPCIQEDEIGFPGESFDNMPIKLANNGEWLMASPSRISRNFSLFHACANGNDYYFREIPRSSYYKMEDIAMSLDNDQEEMSMGLLSGYLNTSLKNVLVCNYSIPQGRFDFDTSYHFNTQLRDIRSSNLSHESFISVPGGGYMLLKEYGYPFESERPELPPINPWETAYLLANYTEPGGGNRQLKPGYTLNHGLSPIPFVQNRGDLNLFYFPALSKDSTWSGIIEMEQQAESNNPDLSYLVVPANNKLYIIYNSLDGTSDPLASTTTLNRQGQVEGNALIFWEMKKMLNFQRARRFSSNEIAVPYLNNKNGFSIIRLY